MNNKIILGLLFLMILIPIISAEVELTIPFNKNYQIKRACFNNGTYCSSSAECNFTLTYPNGNTLFDNVLMTNRNSFHELNISSSLVNQLGEYPAIMICCDTGGDITGCSEDTFEILVTGDGQGQDSFPIQLSILILSYICVAVGSTKENLRLFKNLGAIMMMVMGVITLYPGYAQINYSNLVGQSLGFASIGLGFFFLIGDSFTRKISEQGEYYDQENESFYENE